MGKDISFVNEMSGVREVLCYGSIRLELRDVDMTEAEAG
jgi:hypothetical protein